MIPHTKSDPLRAIAPTVTQRDTFLNPPSNCMGLSYLVFQDEKGRMITEIEISCIGDEEDPDLLVVRTTPPIIIRQNAPTPYPAEHGGAGNRLTRLEEMLTGALLEVAIGRSPFSRYLEASQVDQGVKITWLEVF